MFVTCKSKPNSRAFLLPHFFLPCFVTCHFTNWGLWKLTHASCETHDVLNRSADFVTAQCSKQGEMCYLLPFAYVLTNSRNWLVSQELTEDIVYDKLSPKEHGQFCPSWLQAIHSYIFSFLMMSWLSMAMSQRSRVGQIRSHFFSVVLLISPWIADFNINQEIKVFFCFF